jgi:hypothetical protein
LVLDALLDLRALAVVALGGGGVTGQVGEAEAVAIDDVGLAGQPEIELPLGSCASCAPWGRRRGRRPDGRRDGMISRNGLCSHRSGTYVVSAA